MIHIGFEFSIPLKKRESIQKDYFCKEWLVTKHKFIETQLTRSYHNFSILGFSFSYHPYQSHAGPALEINLLGHFFILAFRDSRHWNHDKGRWYLPGEEEAEWEERQKENDKSI